jgi:hypothetical protein
MGADLHERRAPPMAAEHPCHLGEYAQAKFRALALAASHHPSTGPNTKAK